MAEDIKATEGAEVIEGNGKALMPVLGEIFENSLQ